MLNIKPTDLVLEIGSGNRPRKRSNVLCDKFIEDNYQRGGNLIVDHRPFVAADGLALPFKDKCFDYVITSHILEHVDDPRRFVQELTRVARAGYIETPTELGEKIFGWSFHKWMAHLESDTIVLRPRQEDSIFGDFFHRHYERDTLFAEFVDSHYDDFYVRYEWKGEIKLRVEDDSSRYVKFNKTDLKASAYSKAKTIKLKIATVPLRFVLKILRHFRKFDR